MALVGIQSQPYIEQNSFVDWKGRGLQSVMFNYLIEIDDYRTICVTAHSYVIWMMPAFKGRGTNNPRLLFTHTLNNGRYY